MNDFLSCMKFCCQNQPFPAETNVVRGETVKGLDVKKFHYHTKCNFSFPNMLSLSNPK